MKLVLAVMVMVGLASAAVATEANQETMCGRPADLVQIMVDMQGDGFEGVWRETRIFINKDTEDGTLWAFSMPHTTVHPAAMCRRVITDGAEARVETGIICMAAESACRDFTQRALPRMEKIETGTP